jgi:hemoglobin
VRKKDILERKDIENMVNLFYEKIKKDDLIGYIFNDLVKVEWDKHLPVMYEFWEGVLFFTGGYTGNPMITHRKLNHVVKLTPDHFNRWLKLFIATINENFEGEKAELAKQRAMSIATVMQLKIAN